jgi:hypothetical protein
VLNTVNPINEAIRSIFMTFDMCIYYLLRFVYQLFFHIATFNILDSELIYNMFSRIQLIIGVFMLFQLVMIIIKGIVNPDTVTDSKTGGAGNIIMRIIVSLALLALIVPINISNPRNEYEKQVNNNGILFGTLYSLQYRILSNNTIARLILGDEDTAVQDSPYDPLTGNTMFGSLNRFANRFTATVIKMFYVPYTDSEGNYVCNDPLNNVYQKTLYEDDDTEPFLLIAGATNTCTPIPLTDVSVPGGTSTATGGLVNTGEVYSISMSFLLSTLAGGALVILLIMITFEVAKRVFQLAALQLLAPIPIISYMDPKGSKDSAFNSWVKLLGTTYLELFIRLAVIFFAFAIITSFIDKYNMFGSIDNLAEGVVDVAGTGWEMGGNVMATLELTRWTFIIMSLALLIFAKDAPKFIKQMLGIKDNGGHFFSTIGMAMGFGATAVATVGSFQSGRSASRAADIQNHDKAYADRFGNRAKHLLAGIVGAGKGLAAGSAAASESKGNGLAKMMASWKAMDQVSDSAMQNGVTGSTFVGRTLARGSKIVQGAGNTDFDRETRAISQKKDIEKSAKDLSTYLKGKGKTDGANYAVTTDNIIIDDKGTKHRFSGSVNEFSRIRAQALADQQARIGNGSFTFGGLQLNANDQGLMEKIEDELCLSAGDEWALRQEYGQRNAKRIVELKLLHPGFNDAQIKNQLELEVRTDLRTQNPTWSQAQIDAETIRRTVASNIDSGYAQKRDTYNEDIKGADDPNNVKLYNEYTFDEANGAMTNTSTMVNKASKAAGGEAVRRESNAIYKKQKADFGAIKKNGG